ncbi:hypothetical protein HK102_010319, partial [Quaeritorhiza haematococci]
MLLAQILDFMIIILVIAAVAEAATKDYEAAVVLMIVVVLNVLIGFTQEYKANKALEALMSLSVPKATVIRDGQQSTIDSAQLVPGDIVVLDEGDAIPADLRLCEVSQLEIVEAILTGESVPTSKSIKTIRKRSRKLPLGDCKGNAFMATVVAKGRGKGIVVRTGEDTEIGKISKAIVQQPPTATSIQKKLTRLGQILVAVSLFLCALVVVIGIAYGKPAEEMLKVGISLAVSVIPEGLVAVVTVTMAIGVRRMAMQNAIVRKLPSVETLGSVTVICSDKTGTLTEGKMGTAELWTSDNSLFTFTHSTSLSPELGSAQLVPPVSLTDALSNPEANAGTKDTDRKQSAQDVQKGVEKAPWGLIAGSLVAGCCNNASVIKGEEGDWKPIGDPTEVAMIVAAQKSGFPRDYFQTNVGIEKMGEYPFDSDRKLMSVVYTQSKAPSSPSTGFSQDTTFILAKGAPEGVLTRCTHYLPPPPPNAGKDGDENNFFKWLETVEPAPLTEAYVNYVSLRSSHMASSGLRVLALAMRRVKKEEGEEILKAKKEGEAERELWFVGLIGLIDPP